MYFRLSGSYDHVCNQADPGWIVRKVFHCKTVLLAKQRARGFASQIKERYTQENGECNLTYLYVDLWSKRKKILSLKLIPDQSAVPYIPARPAKPPVKAYLAKA